jgi:hypothetical protein
MSPNPVYEGDLTVDMLLDKWNSGTVLDIDAYADRSYPSIHIGEVHFCQRMGQNLKMCNSQGKGDTRRGAYFPP